MESQGAWAPGLFLALFLVASFLMIWRLEAMSAGGFEGTVLGTLVMPYCSGMGNLIFAFILRQTGGSGADVITLGKSLVNGSIDLGAGSDILQLATLTNRVSISNVETILGSASADTIILSGSIAALVVAKGGLNFLTGNSAAGTFVFDQASAGNVSTILNFSSAKGDKIGLDTLANGTLSTNTYDLGGAALVDLTNIKSVADATTRLATTLSTGGSGGFVYEQDTGELYFNSTGAFAGGGTLVGIITSNGTTPWVYAVSSFQQV